VLIGLAFVRLDEAPREFFKFVACAFVAHKVVALARVPVFAVVALKFSLGNALARKRGVLSVNENFQGLGLRCHFFVSL